MCKYFKCRKVSIGQNLFCESNNLNVFCKQLLLVFAWLCFDFPNPENHLYINFNQAPITTAWSRNLMKAVTLTILIKN